MNTNKPIWLRKAKEVKDEEYNEFYKTISKVCYLCEYLHFILQFNRIL